MRDKTTILLACRPMNYQGQNLLQERWSDFLEALCGLLQQSGFENKESSPALIVFSFNSPISAITSIFNTVAKLKKDFPGAASDGGVPVQFIVHLVQQDDYNLPICNPDNPLWDLLKPETVYITRPLKSQWEILNTKKQLPACSIKNEGDGIFRLHFTDEATIQPESLLSFRSLPVSGSQKECFYCGMKSHQPASCPSKFLNMELDGLAEAGYLPFEELNMTYKEVFGDQAKLIAKLASGIKPGQLRKNRNLMVYLAFFDINQIFQPRFLWNMTFSVYTKWDTVFDSEKLQIDSKNLQLGLDCLRVNQYGQAEELFLKENHPKLPKRFYATVGMAFLALEQGRRADMRNHLELAASIATQEKERLYSALLLSRYYDINNESWKARDILKNIITVKSDCQETIFRKIQLEVKGNFTEDAFNQLRSMMSGQRHLYMTVLMDPSLLPIQTKVDDILSTQYYTIQHSAKNSLIQANHEINDLRQWFDSKDKQMLANLKTLDNLTKLFEGKSYFGVLDVENRAKALLAAGHQLRESKLNKLYDQISRATTKWSGYYHFWAGYKFKNLFKNFYNLLIPQKDKLKQAKALAKKNSGKTYRQAKKLLAESQRALTELGSLFRKMTFVNLMFNAAIMFAQKLLIVEAGLNLLLIVLVAALGTISGDSSLSGLVKLAGDPWFQKKALVFTSLLLSPIAALSWTLIKMNR